MSESKDCEVAARAAKWLASLRRHEKVRPCRVSLDNKQFWGARYETVLYYTPSMMAVAHGAKKVGDNYRTESIYLVGKVPSHNRVCFPFEGREWYVSCYTDPKYMSRLTPEEHDRHHPFGLTFNLAPWPDGSRIDDYEPEPYRRASAAITMLPWKEE